eukprot:4751084-Alexandrium_andersonii.AAC.1
MALDFPSGFPGKSGGPPGSHVDNCRVLSDVGAPEPEPVGHSWLRCASYESSQLASPCQPIA